MSTPSMHRPSRRVFWVRRLAALLVVLGVVAAVVLAVRLALPAAGADSAQVPTTTKSAPPSPAPPGVPVACTADEVDLAVSATSTSYTASQNPAFTVTITHVGRTPCLVDASPTGRPVTVAPVAAGAGDAETNADAEAKADAKADADADAAADGSDAAPVYSTADCGKGERTLLMGDGDVDSQTYHWDRLTTSAGCAKDQRVPVEPGRYAVTASLAGIEGAVSDPVEIALERKPAPSPEPTTAPTDEAAPSDGATAAPEPTD